MLRGVFAQGAMVERYQHDKKVSWHLKGNGGMNSTQKDMYLWHQALQNNSILTENSFELLTGKHSVIRENEVYYGYGWGISESTEQTKRISHNGSNGNFAHSIIWFPKEDILILFATNAASLKTERMAKPIERLIFEADYQAAPVEKSPFFAVFDFTNNHPSTEAGKLLEMINDQYKEAFDRPDILNFFGYQYLQQNRTEWAIELFKINTEFFPKNSNGWDSLGDAYLVNQQPDQAKKSFEKAVQLGDKNSAEKLAKLNQ